MFARVAHKLPHWAVVYPFESFVAVSLLTTGMALFLGVVEGFRPLGGALTGWALYGLPLVMVITAFLIGSNIREHDGRGLAASLYTAAGVSAIYAVLLALDGLSAAETIIELQVAALIVTCVLRASHLRAADKALNKLLGR